MPQPRIMFYHDGRHALMYMYEPPIEREEFEAGVDELVGTPIEALMFCLGDGRTLLHDTQVGELWGHNVEKWQHLIFRRTYQNAKHLIETRNDPLRIICDRARAKGLLVYPTLLMQLESGERGGGGYDVRSSDFRLDNKHLEIGARGDIDPSFPGIHCADFMHKEVREERLAIVEEVVTNYEVDGFELHLNFWPYYFRPDEVDAGRQIMTEWVESVYETVKNRAPERELAITIPSNVQDCMSRGLDPQKWIRQGIVDVLIAQSISRPHLRDPNGTSLVYERSLLEDLRFLVETAKGSNCRIHAAIDSHVDSDRLGDASIEMIRAAACNYWAQGVDGLYLNQWFGNWPYDASFYEKLRELPHPDIMAFKDKSYHIPTETGRFPQPESGAGLTAQLPAILEVNKPARLEFTISDDLPRWDKVGRIHEVLLRIRIMNTTECDRLRFRFNGVDLPDNQRRVINEMYRMRAPRYRTGSGYWFIYRPDRRHWPQKGENILEVTLLHRDPDVTPQVYVRDVEMEIKYLEGKHFHRGQDEDLGPYERSGI